MVSFCDLPLHIKQHIYKIAHRSEHREKLCMVFDDLFLKQAFYEMRFYSSVSPYSFHTWLNNLDSYELERLYYAFLKCKCCVRHQLARPSFNSTTCLYAEPETGVNFTKSNGCQCPCRHYMRWLVQKYRGSLYELAPDGG